MRNIKTFTFPCVRFGPRERRQGNAEESRHQTDHSSRREEGQDQTYQNRTRFEAFID